MTYLYYYKIEEDEQNWKQLGIVDKAHLYRRGGYLDCVVARDKVECSTGYVYTNPQPGENNARVYFVYNDEPQRRLEICRIGDNEYQIVEREKILEDESDPWALCWRSIFELQ